MKTYLRLATPTGTDKQTAVAFATDDRTLQQVAELLVCSVVRRRVVLAIDFDLVNLGRSLQRPQDCALLAFEQPMQMLRQDGGQFDKRLFPLLPLRFRR